MMHIFPRIFIAIISLCVVTVVSHAAPNSSGLLFYAPFQTGTNPTTTNGSSTLLYNQNIEIGSGKVGSAVKLTGSQSQLVYDGPGNAYSQAGTASFYWRLDADPQGKSVSILNLSPLEKTDKERYLLLSYVAGKFRVYLSAGNQGGQTLTSQPILVLPGNWHQLILCWDQTYGVALLVDGEVALHLKKPWYYDGAIGSIGLGVSNTPGRSPMATFSQSIDELRIYDRWLDDANLQRLIRGQAANSSELKTPLLVSQRLAFNQWNRDHIARLPQLKLAGSGGLGLRQASVDSGQRYGRELFDGQRAASWPSDKSTFNQTLQITMAENQSFDMVQMQGIGHLVLTRVDDNRQLLDFRSDTEVLRYFMTPPSNNARQLQLKTFPPSGKDLFETSGASYIQFFHLTRYPYEFDSSWQKQSLRSASTSDRSMEAMLHIRQAFYSVDQQAFIAQDYPASGQATVPAMHTFHIVGPAPSTQSQLDAVAMELKLHLKTSGFARVQLMNPENPLHFLSSVDIYLSDGVGTLRIMLDSRDVAVSQGARPTVSILLSEDATIDLADSVMRYKWK